MSGLPHSGRSLTISSNSRTARLARNGHDHGLAVHLFLAGLPVGHEVGLASVPDRPSAIAMASSRVRRETVLPCEVSSSSSVTSRNSSIRACFSASLKRNSMIRDLVADRHDRLVFLGGDHVVDVDVGAEHRLGVAVVQAHRRAGHAEVDGIRQRVAHVLGQAVLGLAGLGIEVGLEAVLRAVRFVGDHDDVGALAQHRHVGLAGFRRELVDGGEEHAAGLDLRELLAQIVAAVGLHGRGAQGRAAVGEGVEELPVQVLAVGDQTTVGFSNSGRSRNAMT
jgi:hypothetical protein